MVVAFDEALLDLAHERAEKLHGLEAELATVAKRLHDGTADAGDARIVADYAHEANVPIAAARGKVDAMVAVLKRHDELTALADPEAEAAARAEAKATKAKMDEIRKTREYWRGKGGGDEQLAAVKAWNKACRKHREARQSVDELAKLRAEHPELFEE